MKQALAALVFVLSTASSRADEILVFAAASLTESLQEIGRAFEKKSGTAVRFSFGASSDLARQIQAGAPADVFSADTARMDALERSGLVRHEDRREFLSNQLVVVVAHVTAAAVRELLLGPGLAVWLAIKTQAFRRLH